MIGLTALKPPTDFCRCVLALAILLPDRRDTKSEWRMRLPHITDIRRTVATFETIDRTRRPFT